MLRNATKRCTKRASKSGPLGERMSAGCLAPLPTKTSGARSEAPASAADSERQQLFSCTHLSRT